MDTRYLVINPSMMGHPAEHGEPSWDEPDLLSDSDFRAWGYPHAGWFALDHPHLIVTEAEPAEPAGITATLDRIAGELYTLSREAGHPSDLARLYTLTTDTLAAYRAADDQRARALV